MAGWRLAGSWLEAGWRWMVGGWLAGWMLAGWLASFKNVSQFFFLHSSRHLYNAILDI